MATYNDITIILVSNKEEDDDDPDATLPDLTIVRRRWHKVRCLGRWYLRDIVTNDKLNLYRLVELSANESNDILPNVLSHDRKNSIGLLTFWSELTDQELIKQGAITPAKGSFRLFRG